MRKRATAERRARTQVWLVCRGIRYTRGDESFAKSGPTITVVKDWSADMREANKIANRLTEETGKRHFLSPGTIS